MNPLNSTFSPFTNRKRPGKFNSITSTPLMSPRSSSNLLFTPTRTPLRPPPSYSLSETPNSAQKITDTPQNRQMRYANITACTDGKSPGLHSRIVQYDKETRSSLPATHQTKYGSPGLFPVVHFFKKETPVITPKAKKVTVRLASPDLHWYNKSPLLKRTISEASPETRNGHYHPKLSTETETRSVLDALREISRKRIHTSSDFDNTTESSCKRQRRGDGETYEGNKRAREESPKSDSAPVSPSQPQAKKICVVDLLAASYTSSQLLKDKMEKALKRKQELSDIEADFDLGSKEDDQQQTRKQLKLTNTSTQTTDTHKTVSDVDAPKVLEKPESEVKEQETTPEPEVKQSSIFDMNKLEIHRKNKLSVLLGAITGEKPNLLPIEKAIDEGNQITEKPEGKLVGILSPTNKPKHDKHVHFNLTPEVKSIENLESGNQEQAESSTPSKSAPIINFETPKTAPKPKISINAPPESSLVGSAATTANLTNLTFSFGAPKLDPVTSPTSSSSGGFKFNLSPEKTSPPTFDLTAKNTTASIAASTEESTAPNAQTTSPIFSVANSSNSTKTTVSSSGSNLSGISFGGDTTKTFGGFGDMSSSTSLGMVSQGSLGLSVGTTAPTTSLSVPKSSGVTPNFGLVQFSPNATPVTATTVSTFGSGDSTTAASLTFGTRTTAASTTPTFSFGSNTSTEINTKPSGFGPTTTTASSGFSFGGSSTGFAPKTTAPSGFNSTFTGFGTNASNPAFGTTTNTPPAFGTTTTTATGFGTNTATGFGTTVNPPAFGSPATTTTGFGTTTATSAFGAPVPTTATTTTGFGATAKTPAFGTPATTTPGFGTSGNPPAFGTPTTTATGFGTTANPPAFGSATTTKTGFGTAASTFGAPVTTATGFGAGTNTPAFGAPAATVTGFGSTTNTPAFGATATTTSGGFGTSVFGGSATNASGFGTGTGVPAFGASTTSASGFPTATTTVAGFGAGNGFGTPAAPKFGGNFAPTTTTTAASGFGTSNFGAPTTTASSFGATTTTASGFGFGAPATTASTFGGFGGATNAFGGKPAAQPSAGFGGTGNSGFGTPSFSSGQTAQTPSIFGAASNNNNNNSAFPATTTSTPSFGTNAGTTKAFNFGGGNATAAPSGNFNGSGAFGFGGSTPNTTSGGSVFNAAKPTFGNAFGGSTAATTTTSGAFGSTPSGFGGGSFGNNTTNFPSNTAPNNNQSFGGANASFGGSFGGGFGNGDATTNFAKPQSTGTGFVAGAGDSSTFQFGQIQTNPTGNTASAGGPVFAFGGGANPTTTTAPTGGVFAFGNAEAKPNVNFGTPASGFGGGTAANFGGAPATPQFGAPSPGMFSIGSGSSTGPRQRHQLKAKRRT